MKDRLVTIVLSVASTLGIVNLQPQNETAPSVLEVDRLIVRKELIVSDTGQPWEQGYEQQQIPRGIYARSVTDDAVGGLWVRSRLIKCEIDDPFDDRFHAVERDGTLRRAPGHISWNVWLDGAWRQMAIVQGEGLEYSEVPREAWNGTTHPGRIRLQSFRTGHGEPLTDLVVGQGRMSLGGGGFGGGGLPYPDDVLEVWGGKLNEHAVERPAAPAVVRDDDTGEHFYALVAVGPQGRQSRPSVSTRATGLATLRWDSVPGADAYIVIRDGKPVAGPLRIEGSQKEWTDGGTAERR